MQTSYAQDLGANSVEHGLYGSIMQGLGSCCGLFGASGLAGLVDTLLASY